MKEPLLSSLGTINRIHFTIRIMMFTGVAFFISVFALNFFSHWHHGTHYPLGIFVSLLASLIALYCIAMQSIKRLNALRQPPIYSALLVVPFVNVALILFLMVAPASKATA